MRKCYIYLFVFELLPTNIWAGRPFNICALYEHLENNLTLRNGTLSVEWTPGNYSLIFSFVTDLQIAVGTTYWSHGRTGKKHSVSGLRIVDNSTLGTDTNIRWPFVNLSFRKYRNCLATDSR